MTDDRLLFELSDGIAILTLNRPGVMKALGLQGRSMQAQRVPPSSSSALGERQSCLAAECSHKGHVPQNAFGGEHLNPFQQNRG